MTAVSLPEAGPELGTFECWQPKGGLLRYIRIHETIPVGAFVEVLGTPLVRRLEAPLPIAPRLIPREAHLLTQNVASPQWDLEKGEHGKRPSYTCKSNLN